MYALYFGIGNLTTVTSQESRSSAFSAADASQHQRRCADSFHQKYPWNGKSSRLSQHDIPLRRVAVFALACAQFCCADVQSEGVANIRAAFRVLSARQSVCDRPNIMTGPIVCLSASFGSRGRPDQSLSERQSSEQRPDSYRHQSRCHPAKASNKQTPPANEHPGRCSRGHEHQTGAFDGTSNQAGGAFRAASFDSTYRLKSLIISIDLLQRFGQLPDTRTSQLFVCADCSLSVCVSACAGDVMGRRAKCKVWNPGRGSHVSRVGLERRRRRTFPYM